MTTQDATTQRNAALRLLADGGASVAEVANLLGTSRQRVQYWADAAGIDSVTARTHRLAAAWVTAWCEAVADSRTVEAKPATKPVRAVPYSEAHPHSKIAVRRKAMAELSTVPKRRR
jgi:hypothetical protein